MIFGGVSTPRMAQIRLKSIREMCPNESLWVEEEVNASCDERARTRCRR